MKKLIILTVVFLCLIHIISGYTAGEIYTITNISKCYGDLRVKVVSSNDIVDDEYSIINCKGEDNMWTCDCKDDSVNIQILTDAKTTNVYDITVEYYLLPLTNDNITDDSNKRTKQFTNIGFKSIKEPVKFPEFEGGRMILIVVGSIFLFIGVIVFLLWKFVFKGEGDISDREIDREIDEYTRKYSK